MIHAKTFLLTEKTNGERELVDRDNNEAQLAYSKVAALHKRPAIAMTNKHPMLTPATLESNFEESIIVSKNILQIPRKYI